MTTVIALHTIHRPGKTKGLQEVVEPGKPFECSGKEYEDLKRQGAIKDAPKQAEAEAKAKPAKTEKSDAKKDEKTEKPKSDDDGLGDL
ncbi:hypothetical protein [Billgrantia desiderata]|uniref:hypothetical protein n=1 Tax=Billgrantia desiderata TaxID=52021 RepID=UPI001F45E288|nr:hypothetical protein [Halomonas desiderata]MCE8012886.1 hypothetical protein [Halomonas desiderata]